MRPQKGQLSLSKIIESLLIFTKQSARFSSNIQDVKGYLTD
jgi:hypothetical protein